MMDVVYTEPGWRGDDQRLLAEVSSVLSREYPGYSWLIGLHTDPSVGMMYIICAELQAAIGYGSWGVSLPLSNLYQDPSLTRVIQRAGFLLEFAGLPRVHDPETPVKTDVFFSNYNNYRVEMMTGLKG